MVDSIELPSLGDNIIRTVDVDFEPNPDGLGYELFSSMKKFKDKIAQIDVLTDERETYDSLLKKCVRAAVQMKARGITSDDIITPCTTNHINTFVPFYASLFIGAKVASLDPSLSPHDMKHLIKLVKPKLIFASPDAIEKIEQSLRGASIEADIIVYGESDKYTSFSELLEPSPEDEFFEPAKVKTIFDTALIYFTSGTTGMSKGICLNHFSLLSQAKRSAKEFLKPETMLLYSPLYWYSAAFARIQATVTGGTVVFGSKFDPQDVWKYFEKYKATSAILCPTEAMIMLKHGRPDNIDTSNLEAILIGGSQISEKNLSALRKLFTGTLILYGYGQTEVAGGIFGCKPTLENCSIYATKGNSIGRPQSGYSYKIVDPETEEILGPNQKGELRIKSQFVMNGYYDTDSSIAWDSDGWLRTGDICYYDEEHWFFVVDRLKEMIKYRGWQIAPAMLENILEQHPAVKTAVVIGVPHEEDVEHALGLVELAENVTNVTPEELQKYVDNVIDDPKKRLHDGVKFITDIPLTPSKKINRSALKSRVLAEIL